MSNLETPTVLAHVQMLWRRGNLDAAADFLARQIAARSGDAKSPHDQGADDARQLRAMLGDIYLEMGRYRAALDAYVAVLTDQPEHVASLQGLAWCLARWPNLALTLPSWQPIADALAHPDVDPDLVAQGGWALLRNVAEPLHHPMLLPLLRQALVTDDVIEELLTRARRQLCLAPPAQPTELALVLTEQGRLNEYVWSISDEERELLPTSPPWVQAMYSDLSAPRAPDAMAERGIGSEGDALQVAPGRVDATQAVRQMYEENPYPRWERISRRPPTDLDGYLTRLSEGRYRPPTRASGGRMLVAGCGTGREMISAALTWSPASVTGVDLSRSSLEYAQSMADQFGMPVDLHQADLLELADSEEQFDVIVCTGVLHHLADPMAGWRVLRDRLRPGGVMLVGLYSQVAREQITAAQQEVRRFPRTLDGIRAARDHLRALPEDDPARGGVVLRDFFYTSGCRDLLMHVQEHQFTIAEIGQAHKSLDLQFLGFEIDPAVRSLHRTLFHRTNNLSDWERFELLYPQTFLGMYQFWSQRRLRGTVENVAGDGPAELGGIS